MMWILWDVYHGYHGIYCPTCWGIGEFLAQKDEFVENDLGKYFYAFMGGSDGGNN